MIERPLRKGVPVQAGDLILQLDPTAQNLKVQQAQAELERLQAVYTERKNGSRAEQIAAAQARVRQLKAEEQLAQQQLNRQLSLRNRRLNTEAELDNAVAELKSRTENLANARQVLLELENGSRAEVLSQADAAVKAQAMLLAQEEKKLADLRIVAPVTGFLEDLPYQQGERIPQGSIAAIMLADEAPYARVYLPEPYLSQMKVGQKVQVRVDGFAKLIDGTIRRISRDPSFTPHYSLQQGERARLVFLTEVDLPDARDLPTGLPVQLLLQQPANNEE